MSNLRIRIVAAVASNGVIGRCQELPWHIPEDLRYFYHLTMGMLTNEPPGIVLVGRRTAESLAKRATKTKGDYLLRGREVLVLTRHHANVVGWWGTPVQSLEQAVQRATKTNVPLWVAGGAEVYAEALPHTQRIYLTHVLEEPWGDTHFPQWQMRTCTPGPKGMWRMRDDSITFRPPIGGEPDYIRCTWERV